MPLPLRGDAGVLVASMGKQLRALQKATAGVAGDVVEATGGEGSVACVRREARAQRGATQGAGTGVRSKVNAAAEESEEPVRWRREAGKRVTTETMSAIHCRPASQRVLKRMSSGKKHGGAERASMRPHSSHELSPYVGQRVGAGVSIQCQVCSGQGFRRSELRGRRFEVHIPDAIPGTWCLRFCGQLADA